MLAIVHAKPENIARVAEIARESFPDPWSEDSFKNELSENGLFSVAFDGGKLEGYVVLRSLDVECELLDIAVAPEARRTGIGEAMLATAVAYAEEHGAEKVWLEVREGNADALRLYKRYGFREVGRRKAYYASPVEDAVLMERKLIAGKAHHCAEAEE